MFAIVFLIAVAVLAWVLAERAERRTREREARQYGTFVGSRHWPPGWDTEVGRDEMYARDELRQLRDEAC